MSDKSLVKPGDDLGYIWLHPRKRRAFKQSHQIARLHFFIDMFIFFKRRYFCLLIFHQRNELGDRCISVNTYDC
jgi:hypothetical protein